MVNCNDCTYSFWGGIYPGPTCSKQGHARIYRLESNCPLFKPTLLCRIFGPTKKHNEKFVGGCVPSRSVRRPHKE